MPAIQPARLKLQVAELSRAFHQPELLIKQLHEILSMYTDRTHKPGQSGEPRPLMQAYNVPLPVMRQILTELKPVARANKEDAMVLSEFLWKQPYWEMRSLAASILGQVVTEDYLPILKKLTGWISDEPEDRVIELILENATTQLRNQQTDLLLGWVKSYLSSDKKYDPNIAIRMLTILVRENDLENLPAIFKLIAPQLRKIPQALRQDMIELVSELARRSPGETAYILRMNLSEEKSSDAAWIIRQVISSFPLNHQESLRAAMRFQELI